MFTSSKAGVLFTIAAIGLISGIFAGGSCPQCTKIEKERARQQAENPQIVGYYDDQLALVNSKDRTSLSADAPSATTDKTKVDSDLALKNKGYFEENDVNLPPIEEKEKSDSKSKNGLSTSPSTTSTGPSSKPGGAFVVQPGTSPTANVVYSTILDILETKNLLSTLDNSFTLFIPSNQAIADLPPGTLQDLMKHENNERLWHVITNHVVAKEILKEDFTEFNNREVKTIGGRNLTLGSDAKGLTIENARIVGMEPAGNKGVIYIINRVLL